MYIKYLLFSSLVFLALSCANRAEEKPEFGKPGTISCYQYENDKDKVVLRFQSTGDSVTGSLEFNYFEKDRNSGTILGEMKDGLLLADYTFQSEGIESVRPVAFKKQGDKLLQGYGEMETRNGKLEFRHPKTLDFDTAYVLKSIDCQ